jgi:hypothetical protein
MQSALRVLSWTTPRQDGVRLDHSTLTEQVQPKLVIQANSALSHSLSRKRRSARPKAIFS